MLQEIFRIPGLDIPIYGYGLMLVIGFLVATQWARFLARRSAIDPEVFVTAGLVALISGVAGARISHILENFGEFTSGTFAQNVGKMLDIRSGGLTYYGGFITATACTIGYGLIVKAPIKRGMDIIAPCLMIGLAFGRIGCFLNGCCYGAECNIHWLGVQYPYYSNAYVDQWQSNTLKTPVPQELLVEMPSKDGSPHEKLLEPFRAKEDPLLRNIALNTVSNEVHPTQLYSAATAFMLAALLSAYFTLPHAAGRVFALMLMLEGGTRFLLEMIRVEPAVVGGAANKTGLLHALPPMSLSMILGIGLVIVGAVMWIAVKGPPDELAYQGEPEVTPASV